MARLTNLSDLIHVSITSSSWCGCRRSSSVTGLRGGRGVKVVSHLRVEFLLGLLRGTAVATTALLASSSLGSGSLGGTGVVFVSRSGLGLGLRLGGALSKRLNSRNDLVSLGCADNDLDLDRSVVDKKTIQFLEGLASAIGLMEGHVCDTAALRVRAVGELDSLDGTNGLDEVLLNLLLRDVLRQIAHNDLAITVGRSGLGWSRLCAGTACGFGALLDTTNGCSRSRASGTTTLVGSAASATALGLGDIIESLIELARHDDDDDDVCEVGKSRSKTG